MRPVLAALLILSACGAPMAPEDLRDRLAGRTLVLDHAASDNPEWPALRWTFGTDGTLTRTRRSVMQPHRPHSAREYWWIDQGDLCVSSSPRDPSNRGATCYDVVLDGDRLEAGYRREVFRMFPHLTLPPRGVLVD